MKTEKTLGYYVKPFLWTMAGGFAIKTTGTFLELALPGILSRIIDDIVPAGDTKGIIIWCVIMVVCALLAWLFNILANRNASRVARNITQKIRHDLFEKTLYLTCSKTDEYTIPSLEGRLTSDTYHVHRMIGMMQRMGVRAPIITIGGLIITFILEPVLSLVFLAVIPFMAVLIVWRASQGIPLFSLVQKASDRMAGVVRENAQGIRVIKALTREEKEKNRFDRVNTELKNQEVHASRKMAMIDPLMNLFLYSGMMGVIIVGAWRVNAGISETGKILAFMSYFQMISRAMMAVSRMFIMYSRGMASSGRIMEVLNSTSEKDWKPEDCPAGDPAYELEFRDVSFSYLNVRNNIENISFRLKKGEKLGIIGATGSGKSTIVSLLLHFYHAGSGQIFVQGKDVRSYEPSALRSLFGTVMQNDFLFGGTIADNIRFGRKISDEKLTQAEKDAQAYEFISALPEKDGYELSVKGMNLSGGQKQRVLLARAFAGDTPFLILDDASSALDYKTDAALRKAAAENYADKTRIIIAQRISSIQHCDQILVLDHGRAAGMGKHEELLKTNALYAAIAESQMGGALFEG